MECRSSWTGLSSQSPQPAGIRTSRLVLCRRFLELSLELPKDVLEGLAIDLADLGVCLCRDGCCAGLILQQRQFPEVVTALVVMHFLLAATFPRLRGHQVALLHEVEGVSRIALLQDRLPFRQGLLLKAVGKLHQIIALQRLEQGHGLQEVHEVIAPLGGRISNDVAEGLAIELPHHRFFGGFHRRSPRTVVKQRQLTKDVALTALLHDLVRAIDLLDAIKGP
mmetsp:Transcript_34723/g.83322  ORF Transcript_34723/g.83322 Transcript_34723/m.83322 type:complete len:223 (-) Transcript_34723:119-787(-)